MRKADDGLGRAHWQRRKADRHEVFLEVELSGLADLVIEFINSGILGSGDVAAYKASKNMLILLKSWWEVKPEEGEGRWREIPGFLPEGMVCCCLLPTVNLRNLVSDC